MTGVKPRFLLFLLAAMVSCLARAADPVDFGDTPEAQLERISTVIENVKDDASRCEIGLKVTDDINKCRKFAQHFDADKGEFIPALLKLNELAGDPDIYRGNADLFVARELDINEITRIQQLVLDRSR